MNPVTFATGVLVGAFLWSQLGRIHEALSRRDDRTPDGEPSPRTETRA